MISDELAYWVKVTATKSDSPNLIPGTHMTERENACLKALL